MLLQSFISEWISSSQPEEHHSFLSEYPELVQYLYQQIKDIVYFLKFAVLWAVHV